MWYYTILAVYITQKVNFLTESFFRTSDSLMETNKNGGKNNRLKVGGLIMSIGSAVNSHDRLT